MYAIDDLTNVIILFLYSTLGEHNTVLLSIYHDGQAEVARLKGK